jgi:hypothetical protein
MRLWYMKTHVSGEAATIDNVTTLSEQFWDEIRVPDPALPGERGEGAGKPGLIRAIRQLEKRWQWYTCLAPAMP